MSVALHVRPRASRPGSSRVEPAELAVHLAYREPAQSPKLYNTMGASMAVYGVCKSWTWGCDFDILIWWLWGEVASYWRCLVAGGHEKGMREKSSARGSGNYYDNII